MFWHAVAGGLRVLLFWETWVGMIVYALLLVIPTAALGAAAKRDMRFGCAGMLVLPFFEVFASIVVLCILIPIILALRSDAAWSLPWSLVSGDPLWMLKVTAGLTVLAFFAGLVPILGRIPTFSSFVVGSFAIALVTRAFANASGREAFARIDYAPGFWSVIGFLIMGTIATVVVGYPLAVLGMITAGSEGGQESAPGPIAMSVFGVLGLIPVFMYGAWLGLQFKSIGQ